MTTQDQFQQGDTQLMFRRQNNRTLYDIDQLLERQEYLRQQLGEEKVNAIERQPDLFYNHDKFRQW